jgi:hypothetical protein
MDEKLKDILDMARGMEASVQLFENGMYNEDLLLDLLSMKARLLGRMIKERREE